MRKFAAFTLLASSAILACEVKVGETAAQNPAPATPAPAAAPAPAAPAAPAGKSLGHAQAAPTPHTAAGLGHVSPGTLARPTPIAPLGGQAPPPAAPVGTLMTGTNVFGQGTPDPNGWKGTYF